MKRIRLNAFLFLSWTCLVFGTSVWARVSPSTWNSFVSNSGFYNSSFPNPPNTSDVVSRFTPSEAIAVTRIEVQAVRGSQRSTVVQNLPCAKPVSFKITDGEQSFTLPLPSAAPFVVGSYNSSSADSGPLDLAFPAGAKIVLSVIPGDPFEPVSGKSPCFANEVNITVQYKVNSPQQKREQNQEQRPRWEEEQK
jgi:hypothetical protein